VTVAVCSGFTTFSVIGAACNTGSSDVTAVAEKPPWPSGATGAEPSHAYVVVVVLAPPDARSWEVSA
jgi:hypothetical protein